MYNLTNLNEDLRQLKAQGAKVFDIGYTLLGRPIPCVFKGNAVGGQTLVHGCIHAREWVTTPLLMEMMKNYNSSGGIWCIPMVNIDGALLCQEGISSIPDKSLQDFVLQVNGGSEDFTLWKANARAVDLNVNFNANWGTGSQNVRYPAPGNYIGQYPMSEPETQALAYITNTVQPNVTLSYHARGEVIYKGFGCIDNYVDCAKKIAQSTGYPLLDSADSAGGYKDWFVATTAKLGLTVEVGKVDWAYDKLINYLNILYKQNSKVLEVASQCAQNIKQF